MKVVMSSRLYAERQCSSERGLPERIAREIHLTQIHHHRYNPDGEAHTEDCSPASLAMGLRALGLAPRPLPGFSSPNAPQGFIDRTRFAMFSDRSGHSIDPVKDGIRFDARGRAHRDPAGHQALTNLPDLERGGTNSGARSKRLYDLEGLHESIDRRSPVLLAGDPSLPRAYGPRVGVDYRGGHVVLVTGRRGAAYRINDPLSGRGPVWVPRDELEAFLSTALFGDVLGLELRR